MNVRFTLPFSTSREVGKTYLNSQGLVLGVILNKTENSTKISAFGDCAIKCDFDTNENYMVPVWYDFNSNEFKHFTPEDLNQKIVGYIKPCQKDSAGNIISDYDMSLREFIFLGF